MSLINPMATLPPVAPTVAIQIPRDYRAYDLRVDQIVQASVAEGGMERVTLELDGQRLSASSKIPLHNGQQLTLRVLATKPSLHLSIVEDLVSERLTRLLPLLGQQWDLLPLLQRLSPDAGGKCADPLSSEAQAVLSLVKAFMLRAEEADGPALQRLLQGLGTDLEALLAAGEASAAGGTLKGAFSSLGRHLEKDDPETASLVHRTLGHLEFFQMAGIRLCGEGSVLFPLPLPYLQQGFLTVTRHEEMDEDPAATAPLRVNLYLSLEGLGDLHVDILFDASGMHLRFLCNSMEKARFLAGFRESLEEVLRAFPVRGVIFATGAERPAQALMRQLWPGQTGVLDTRV